MPKVVISSELKAARAAADEILRQVAACRYLDEAHFAIKLALEEALVNAIKHGNQSDPAAQITVEYDVNADRTIIQVTDQGCGFKPESLPDPRTQEHLENPFGRGVMLMRAYMDEVNYNPCGNSVRMLKRNR